LRSRLTGTPSRPLSPRPDACLLESQHAKLEQIVIHDIKDSTFFAKLIIRSNGEVQEIDARPSDGIALPRCACKRDFCHDKMRSRNGPGQKTEVQDTQKFKKFIDELKPSDFVE